jgi:hypothetical protein
MKESAHDFHSCPASRRALAGEIQEPEINNPPDKGGLHIGDEAG